MAHDHLRGNCVSRKGSALLGAVTQCRRSTPSRPSTYSRSRNSMWSSHKHPEIAALLPRREDPAKHPGSGHGRRHALLTKALVLGTISGAVLMPRSHALAEANDRSRPFRIECRNFPNHFSLFNRADSSRLYVRQRTEHASQIVRR